jgi:hypothetical protein
VLVLMLVPALWGVVQLTVLGSLSRSIRLSTGLLGVATGLYGCGLLAVVLELGSTSLYAAISGRSKSDAIEVASYTVDPVIEEVVKVLPLVLGWLLARRFARGLGLVDHLIIGAACGSGFGLLESVMRYGTVRMLTMSAGDSGYIVAASLGGSVTVPGIGESLGSWLPAPTVNAGLLGDPTPGVGHLVWTALAAVGIGWLCTHRGPTRLLGLVPLAYVCYDHCRYNWQVASGDDGSSLLDWLHDHLGLVVFLALVAATVGDRVRLARARAAHPELLLAGESTVGILSPPLFALGGAAVPWTAAIANRFARTRRSVLYATTVAAGDPSPLAGEVVRIRDQIASVRDRAAWGRATARLHPWTSLRAGLHGRRLALLLVWLALCAASVVYYVIGGFPSTRGIQQALGGVVGTVLFTALAVVVVAWLVWRLVRAVPALRRTLRGGGGEVAVRAVLRLWTAAGAAVAGAILVVHALGGMSGDTPLHSNFHVLEALSRLLLIAGLALVLAGFFMFPPLGLLVTADGMIVAGTLTVTEGLIATTAGGLTLAGLGVVLNEVAGDGSGGEGDGSGGDGASARQQRLDELSRDPAHGGKITPGSREEAEAALGLEERGQLSGPVTRSADPSADFVDGAGRPWDVKAFRSSVPGRRGAFDLTKTVTKIRQELRLGENVILDTRNLTSAHTSALKQAVQQLAESGGKVLFWP